MMDSDALFDIAEVAIIPRKEAASGCDLCQHCFLLRRAFLEKQRQEKLARQCSNETAQERLSAENISKE